MFLHLETSKNVPACPRLLVLLYAVLNEAFENMKGSSQSFVSEMELGGKKTRNPPENILLYTESLSGETQHSKEKDIHAENFSVEIYKPVSLSVERVSIFGLMP